MRKLAVFNHMTLDGYFAGPNGDISWAFAEGRVLENTGPGIVEQHEAGEERPGGGNTNDEERARKTHDDSGKRQHCVAIGAGGFDR